MIFLTIGTQYPFERLVKAVDEACAQGIFEEEIFGQIGKSTYQPRHFTCTGSLDNGRFNDCVSLSTAIIGHAGVGTISIALKHNKPLLTMPRLARYREHVNDHQVGLARKFEGAGHILVAYSQEELPEKMRQLRDFVPQQRECQRQMVVSRIENFLRQVQTKFKSQGRV
jgi:beta-1,4-N-acetylglucosaminyltransferase